MVNWLFSVDNNSKRRIDYVNISRLTETKPSIDGVSLTHEFGVRLVVLCALPSPAHIAWPTPTHWSQPTPNIHTRWHFTSTHTHTHTLIFACPLHTHIHTKRYTQQTLIMWYIFVTSSHMEWNTNVEEHISGQAQPQHIHEHQTQPIPRQNYIYIFNLNETTKKQKQQMCNQQKKTNHFVKTNCVYAIVQTKMRIKRQIVDIQHQQHKK